MNMQNMHVDVMYALMEVNTLSVEYKKEIDDPVTVYSSIYSAYSIMRNHPIRSCQWIRPVAI